MSEPWDLVYVTPHDALGATLPTLPTRPARLLAAMRASGSVGAVTVVNRRRPAMLGPFLRRRSLEIRTTLEQNVAVVEHPLPFGFVESAWLARLVRRTVTAGDRRLVVWVADPKAAGVLGRLGRPGDRRCVRVFDAYDAWDRSPLVHGWWRRRAVVRGYETAASSADLVVCNTPLMADRMRRLGARRVVLLPNAAPEVADGLRGDTRAEKTPYLLYVGRVHERIDAGLLSAVSDAAPGALLRIVGPVEQEPAGWTSLVARSNVRLEGPIVGQHLMTILAGAVALLVPHHPDDYTRSQDAMKAWDALAVGTPVISTPVPPVTEWPPGLAVVASSREAFAAGAQAALAGSLETNRDARLAFARSNGWAQRAATVVAEIAALMSER